MTAVAEPPPAVAAPSLETVFEAGRRAAGTAVADGAAIAEAVAAARGRAGADGRDAADRVGRELAAGAVALALPPGVRSGTATFAAARRPRLLAGFRGAPGFGAGRDDALVLVVVAAEAPAVELREGGEALDGRVWEAQLRDVAPLATFEAGKDGERVLAQAHLRHAAYLAGAADALIAATRERATERRQFGVRISEFQAVAFAIAAHAGRWRALRAHVEALASGEASTPAAAGLLAAAAELALATASDLVPLHGAHGLTDASPAQRLHRHIGLVAARWGLPRELRDHARELLDDEGDPTR